MATIQIRVDDNLKASVDNLFAFHGLDTSTAARMFLAVALENDGIPFAVKRIGSRKPNAELREALEDVRLEHNLYGPFATAPDCAYQQNETKYETYKQAGQRHHKTDCCPLMYRHP